ncbi:hypothetical protein GGR58DRAFT_506550 [Xylaria digitata]|nr:hypothetical protein GGR58DRAFT_506550 [Xylaria digitata]
MDDQTCQQYFPRDSQYQALVVQGLDDTDWLSQRENGSASFLADHHRERPAKTSAPQATGLADYHHTYPRIAPVPTDATNGLPAQESSSRTGTPKASRQYICPICSSELQSKKDLKRHSRSVHSEYESLYHCGCGKADPRKDNHTRHVHTCKKRNSFVYMCRCNFNCMGKDIYLEHIKGCDFGFGIIGRPRTC